MSDSEAIDRLLGRGSATKPSSTSANKNMPLANLRKPLYFGSVPIPNDLETRHNLAIGTTGAGKTQAFYTGILDPIRERTEPILLVDHSSEFLQRYFRPDIDLIFNPFDQRSVKWTVFNEIRRIYDFDRLSRAIIPDLAGENQDWQLGAQQTLSSALESLYRLGDSYRTNERLVHYLTYAPVRNPADPNDLNTLSGLLANTTSSRLFETGAERQCAITLGIISRHLKPLTYVPDGPFSVSDWIGNLESGIHDGWLFLSYDDASYSAIRSIISIMVSFAVQSALSLSESQTRRFHFVLDEFPSLDKIDAIADALTKMRKRGGVVTVGVQSTAQLEQKYGKLGAQTLLSCFGNLLMLRVSDDDTAEKLSRLIGDVEVFETSFNNSETSGMDYNVLLHQDGGYSPPSSTAGTNRQKQVKRLVLASEFFGLPDRTGYVRIAGRPMIERTSVSVTTRVPITPPNVLADGVFL